MKHRIAGLAMAGAMMSAAFMIPQPAAAYRGIWLNRSQQEQAVQVTSISPADADAQELLNLLNIQLEPSDPVWQDQSFTQMVLKYKDIKAKSLGVVSNVGDIVVEAFDLADLLSHVDNDSFRQQFTMTEEERLQLQQMRVEFEQQLSEFKKDPEGFLTEFLSQLADNGYHFDDNSYTSEAISAYGYADPYEPVKEGQVVWLMDGSYNPSGEDWTTEWTQIDGPDVTWLNTDSAHDKAFIVPSLEGYPDLDYLTFELYVKDAQGNESTSYVYVDLSRANAQTVAGIFRDVMGYDINDEDLAYWNSKYEQGMSLDEIRQHFELFQQNGW